jgi:hypothetical protein
MSGHQAVRDWRTDLMERHPGLFRIKAGAEAETPGYPAVGDGWRDLVETMARRIAQALAAVPPGSLVFGQIKEKFGTIRIYTGRSGPLPDDIENAIEEAIGLAEARSACTCELCGAEGRLFNRDGYLSTLCDEHAEGELVPIPPRLVHIYVAKTVQDGRRRIRSYRRYDRATDTFVDVAPSELGEE